jgi:atlastin
MSIITGTPLQILDIKTNHKFKLNETNLHIILNNPKVRDHKVCVVAVAGAFRKGKSFLLNFFLRYLNSYNNTNKRNDEQYDWMGNEEEPLTGFNWQSGTQRDTTGIWMWSEPFLFNQANEKIACILMDTQGAFDSEQNVHYKDSAAVFALSLLLSSVHIYNLTHNLQEDDMQHLHLFTDYAKQLIVFNKANDYKPFQKLTFLIRDWYFPYQDEYGQHGGQSLLERRLQIMNHQNNEHKHLRVSLNQSYDSLDCFLMPHPGLKVCTQANFNGQLKEMEKEFREQIKKFTQLTFSAPLTLKQINGRKITCSELFDYFKKYCKAFDNGKMIPEVEPILFATAQVNNLNAKAKAIKHYIEYMELECGGDRPYLHAKNLTASNNRIKEQSIQIFNTAPKLGGDTFSRKYLNELINEMNNLFENYLKHNECKNVFASSRTPISLLILMVCVYFIESGLKSIGIGLFSFTLDFFFWTAMLLLLSWLYVKSSGDYKEIGEYIDACADFLWKRVYHKFYTRFVQPTIKIMLKYGSISSNLNDLTAKQSQSSKLFNRNSFSFILLIILISILGQYLVYYLFWT